MKNMKNEQELELEWTAYGSNARWGMSIGEWASEKLALAYAESGVAGDMGDGVYVCAERDCLPLGTRVVIGK
jgi:hypothetical protein